jgi:hypothetical protein
MNARPALCALALSGWLGCETAPPLAPQTTVTMEPPSASATPAAPSAATPPTAAVGPIAPDIAARLAKFPEAPIGVDESKLDPSAKAMLRKLIEASQIMDEIFLRQVDPGNPALRRALAEDPAAKDALAYFDLMKGPWDRTDPEQRPFIGTRPKPPQGGFYPQDLQKADVEAWLGAHPGDREAFQSYFTVIERRGGGLQAAPFTRVYRNFLEPAAERLRDAAALSKDERLKRFLTLRATAFQSNDYLESDLAWMDLGDAPYEVTIGPYEVYDDELMGWKASYEAYIGLRDAAESDRLAKVAGYLPQLDKNLPLDAKYRAQATRGAASPISVVDVIHSAGQPGIHASAYNLPNDERARQKKGTKKVMLRNIAQAKFRTVTQKIAERLIAPKQQPLVTFDAYFTFILMHEVAHGLGPGMVTTATGTEPVSKALQELYSPIEEAKADICGLVSTQWLIEQGFYPRALERQIYAAALAGVLRAVRFGATEAHSRGALASLNFITDRGGYLYEPKQHRYRVDFDRVKAAVRALAHEWLTIEATGDRALAERFFAHYGKMKPEMAADLKRLSDIPVDVRPVFTVLASLRNW